MSKLKQLFTLPWVLTSSQFVILITLANLALYHFPIIAFTLDNLQPLSFSSIQTLLVICLLVLTISTLALYLLAILHHRLAKIFCQISAITNAIAVFFISNYQVILDKSMMGNMLNTNFEEAGEFLQWKLLVYIILLGILPVYLITKIQIQASKRHVLAIHAVLIIVLSSSLIYAFSSSWLWIDKHAKKLGGMVLPWSYVVNTARAVSANIEVKQILLPPATHNSHHKTLVVLVIGETARAANFSLYGYQRQTNPLLSTLNVIPLQDASACATYTTAAVGCILAHEPSDSVLSKKYEPLPSYLQRHGVEVIWRSNNWGEPPIKVAEYTKASELSKLCQGSGCSNDEVLLSNLKARIEASKQDKILIVLHQKGSHGPAYNQRYPKEFEIFKPVCDSVELSKCSSNTLINAFDNTIVYTDYFLSQVIQQLQQFNDRSTMMMYLSDHGESLGEYQLYLHGTPYAIAPDFQKKIPFIVWMSPQFMQQHQVSTEQLKQQHSHTQYNVFHSLLSALDMQSPIYNPNLDIFNPQSK